MILKFIHNTTIAYTRLHTVEQLNALKMINPQPNTPNSHIYWACRSGYDTYSYTDHDLYTRVSSSNRVSSIRCAHCLYVAVVVLLLLCRRCCCRLFASVNTNHWTFFFHSIYSIWLLCVLFFVLLSSCVQRCLDYFD